MAGAPHKQGLDFVSISVDFFSDRKVWLLEDQLPDRGFKFYLMFKCFIGKQSNHVVWNDTARVDFYHQFNVTSEETMKVLNILLKLDLFDNDLYKKHRVISSADIQHTYLQATHRRQFSIFVQEYLLINLDTYRKKKHVRLTDKDGNILLDFSKRKETKPAKPKHVKKAPEPLPTPPAAPENNYVTANDISAYISIPYKDQPDDFKKQWSEKWYKSYVEASNSIYGHDNLRICKFQLTIEQYKEIIDELKPNKEEFSEAISILAKNGVKEIQMMKTKLNDAIGWARINLANGRPAGSGLNGQPLKPGIKTKLLFDGTGKGGSKT